MNAILEKKFLTCKNTNTDFDDEQSNQKKRPFRAYRDAITEAFCNIFFYDISHLNLFIDYTFNKINGSLQIKLDQELIKNDHLPINGDEQVVFCLKGGNSMHMYFNTIIDSILFKYEKITMNEIKKDLNPQSFNGVYNNIGDFIQDFKSKFLKSDVDYSLYIDTPNYNRFLIIYNTALKILSNEMEEITIFFENYLFKKEEYREQQEEEEEEEEDKEKKIKIDFTLINLKRLIEYLNSTNDIDEDYKNKIINNVKDFFELLNSYMTMNEKKYPNLIYLVKVIKIIRLIIYIDKKIGIEKKNFSNLNLGDILDELVKYVEEKIEKKKNMIIKHDFYTQEKIENFYDEIEKLYQDNKFDNAFYELDTNTNTLNTYKLVKKVKKNNFKLNKRKSTFVTNSTNSKKKLIEIINTNDEKNHYLTFNNIIYKEKKESIINFDLIRIKFNMVLDKELMQVNNEKSKKDIKLPSEFLDVSIPQFNDSSRKIFFSHYKGDELLIINDKKINKIITICSYSIKDIYDDIVYVVFIQNSFLPWVDPKFDKRIMRLLLFSVMEASEKNKLNLFHDFITLCDSINYSISNDKDLDYNMFEKFFINEKLSKDILNPREYIKTVLDHVKYNYNDKYYFDILNLNPKYNDYNTIVRTIILLAVIYKYSDQDMIDFINYYRSYCMMVPYQTKIEQIAEETRKNFKKLLATIVNTGYILYYVYIEEKKNGNILGGLNKNDVFYKKYLKYKKKYYDLQLQSNKSN